jgi:hypothetical protein
MRHARRQQADARKLVRLHEAALEFGAVGDIVEDHEAADLLHVARDERRDSDVEGSLIHLGAGLHGLQIEFIQMMNAHFAARAL